jgi:hypothetical protein
MQYATCKNGGSNMQKVICIITIMTVLAIGMLMHGLKDPVSNFAYRPALIHEIICNGQVHEIMIPPEVSNQEQYAEQYCLTLTSK